MAPKARPMKCRISQSQSSLSRHSPTSCTGLYGICGILTAKCQAVSWATSNRGSLSPIPILPPEVQFCRNLFSQTKQEGVSCATVLFPLVFLVHMIVCFTHSLLTLLPGVYGWGWGECVKILSDLLTNAWWCVTLTLSSGDSWSHRMCARANTYKHIHTHTNLEL